MIDALMEVKDLLSSLSAECKKLRENQRDVQARGRLSNSA
jgi:hypothetical protein